MKKQILTGLLICATAGFANAQTLVTDTVAMGAQYVNQVWYSLENDEQGTQPADNWDIGIDVISFMSSLHINTHGGAKLWNYPKGDKTVYGTALDTTGLTTWGERYNSATTWERGAMGNYIDPTNQFDVDWGIYDFNTHIISGDSVYIIKLVNGNYKQFFVEKLANGTFHFKFADIDGSNPETDQVNKSSFTDKNLGYYSIANKTIVNREPNKDKWDITFTRYTEFVQGMFYPVTGILTNRDHKVRVAQVDNQPNAGSFTGWQTQSFDSAINVIGYDWKSFNGSMYVLKDSTAYFVSLDKNGSQDIWRLYFTGFASADGSSIFEKQKLQAASVKDVNGGITSMALYPNPSNGGNVQVAYTVPAGSKSVMLNVTDIAGKTIMLQELDNSAGMHTYSVPANTLRSGMYIVSVSTVGGRVQQKLVIN